MRAGCEVRVFRNMFLPCFGGLFFGNLVNKTLWREKKSQLMDGAELGLAARWSWCVSGGPGLPGKLWEKGGDPALLFAFNPRD